jgi:hypothetical protein
MRLDEFPFCITAGVILSAAVFQAKPKDLACIVTAIGEGAHYQPPPF